MSKADIDKFVASKERWILSKLSQLSERKVQRDNFTLTYGDTVTYSGKEYPVVAKDGERIGFDDERFYMPPNLSSEQIKSACVRIYRMLAKRDLTNKVLDYAKIMNVMPIAVKINNAKSRWGSCSGKKSLNFSWRLIMADNDVIDYVVVHELAHISQMNHSERFWAIVESVLPDYKTRQKRLKELQNRLNNEDWEYNAEKDFAERSENSGDSENSGNSRNNEEGRNSSDSAEGANSVNDKKTENSLRYHYADYKTILSPKNGMNLYRGCTHGCIYCDSRSACYQMKHDFEDIEVKRNAVRILESQLRRKREPCMIGTGAMCDSYIHLEEELQVTRKCLELIEHYGFGLAIQTKSSRIMRDIDLLRKINEKSKCVVQMTLTTFDEDSCRILEPNVSTTAERVEVLKAMQKEGIPTVVWLSPILPFINDTEENLRGLLDYCIEVEVRGIINFGFGTTMREGSRDYFYSKLDEHFPGMKQKYIKTFGNAYECPSPNSAKLWRIYNDICKQNGIMHKIDDVFEYLNKYESKFEQMSMF
jgi:DNA repair photolyase/predicted metal-dependent hydrolase